MEERARLEIDIEAAIRESNKWKTECESRRSAEKDVLNDISTRNQLKQ